MTTRILWTLAMLAGAALTGLPAAADDLTDKIVFESYVDNNWDLFVINADGSGRRNLTNTPDIHELYPQASPDGRRICFLADTTEGGNTERSIYFMNADGSGRSFVADKVREPCWNPQGTKIAFCKQEFSKFNVTDYVSKGLFIYDLKTGLVTEHLNPDIHHLYNINWSADGNWFVSTVHGGMGYGHAILAIAADSNRVVDLKIGGCRPCLSDDGKQITWSSDDHTICVADLDLLSSTPAVSNVRIVQQDKVMHLYHPDFSPDGRYVVFSMGPGGRVLADGPGTHTQVAEMIGVRGKWNLYRKLASGEGEAIRLTQDESLSNKEPEWIHSARGGEPLMNGQVIRWLPCSVLVFLLSSCAQPDDVRGPGSRVNPIEIRTSSGIEMVILPGGEFTMGSSSGDPDEAPRHQVKVSPLAIDKYEVTQQEYAALELPNPSHFKGERRPVEQIRWSDAALFCNERSRREGLDPCYDEATFECNFAARGYRLPTEAEWEYAARAGADTDYDFGGSPQALKNYACYAGNATGKTDPVGQKKPNGFGLYDLYGNVSEWCHDVYGETYYQTSPNENPRGPMSGKKRVLRGGSWKSDDAACRATIRQADIPGITDACFARDTYGFRCVRQLSPEELQLLSSSDLAVAAKR